MTINASGTWDADPIAGLGEECETGTSLGASSVRKLVSVRGAMPNFVVGRLRLRRVLGHAQLVLEFGEDIWTSLVQELGPLFKQSPEEFARRNLHQIPLGRMERPEDVANVIGFLVASRSAYMTGQAVSVDGGLVMHG